MGKSAVRVGVDGAKDINAVVSLAERIAKIPVGATVTGTSVLTVGAAVIGWLRSVPIWGLVVFMLIGLGTLLMFAVFSSIASLSARTGDISSRIDTKLDDLERRLHNLTDSVEHLIEAGDVEDRKHYRWRAENWRKILQELTKKTTAKASLEEAINSIVSHPDFLDLEPCFSDSTRNTVLRIGEVQMYVHSYGRGTTVHPLLLDIMDGIAQFEKERGLLGSREP